MAKIPLRRQKKPKDIERFLEYAIVSIGTLLVDGFIDQAKKALKQGKVIEAEFTVLPNSSHEEKKEQKSLPSDQL